jgi:opacity protein-like surface antigen
VPFSQTVGGRILVDVSTSNTIIGVGVGPEFAVPYGPVRPYVQAGFSGVLFRTVSSVSGTRSSDEPIATTTNLSDWTRAWVAGAGLRIPLGGRDAPVDLDLGLRYHRGGEARYLREGSIIDNPDGSITINPLVSQTPFMVYSVGVRFRIPWGSPDPCPGWLC